MALIWHYVEESSRCVCRREERCFVSVDSSVRDKEAVVMASGRTSDWDEHSSGHINQLVDDPI